MRNKKQYHETHFLWVSDQATPRSFCPTSHNCSDSPDAERWSGQTTSWCKIAEALWGILKPSLKKIWKFKAKKYLLNFEVLGQQYCLTVSGHRSPPIDVCPKHLKVIPRSPKNSFQDFLSGSLESDVCSRKQPLGNIPRLVQSSKFRLALDY